MTKTLTIAKWEFTTTVTRGAYIFAVIAMPLFYGGMFALAALAGRSAQASTSRAPVAVVDLAHILDLSFAAQTAGLRERARQDALEQMTALAARRSPAAAAVLSDTTSRPTSLVAYPTVDAALTDLRASKVSSVFVVNPDYIATGSITSYSRESGIFARQGDRQRQTELADAIRASLLKPALAGDALNRAYAPATNLSRLVLTRSGDFQPSADDTGLGPIAGSFGVFMLLTMAIFFSAGFMQQATIAERQNKMIEILLSSANPDEIVLGKLIGLSGAGLLQVGIYVALVIVPGTALLSVFQIPALKLALSVVYFFLGFLTFACLMTATGMIGRTAQESAQLSTIWMLIASAPWFFVTNIGAAPHGVLARALSFFPLTSPIAMMMRLSGTDLSLAEVSSTIVVDAIAIALIFRAATKIFRASALMYGKRPTMPEIARWLRAA